jgi:hypothetical protein
LKFLAFADFATLAAAGSELLFDDWLAGRDGHSSNLTAESLQSTEFDAKSLVVDGNVILNDYGIKRPPLNLIQEFFIIASPSVRGGDTLGFGSGPFPRFHLMLK